jgi:peroxiredoxin
MRLRGLSRIAYTPPVMSWRIRGIALAAIVLLSGSAFGLDVGALAPSFANPQLDGTYLLSKNFLGKGWVLLDFFATDCEPCIKELPELQAMADELGSKGFTVLIIATDTKGIPLVKPFVESQKVRLPLVIDRYRVTTERYGVTLIPSVFLVDPKGAIAFKAEGYTETTLAQIRDILASKLSR